MTKRKSNLPLFSAALVLALASQAQAEPGQRQEITFALPSMPLGDALRQVARETRRNLVVDDQLIAGKTAPAISGRFTADQAVE